MRPLISVIMPTYNSGNFILDSIKSVENQTLNDLELIIVDDNSTDNTENVLHPYIVNHSFIRYIRLSKNSGPAVARTEAIKLSKGKYCAFLDADDLWDNNKLEKQISYMRDNDADFSCTGYRLINEYGERINRCLIPPEKTNYHSCIRLADPIGNLTVMYNQEKLGKFIVPNIKKRNDYALWLQILKRTDFCWGLNEVLASYRFRRKGSVSTNKLPLIKYHWTLYHNIENHNIIFSLYEILCWGFVKGTGIGLNIKRNSME